MSGFIDLLTLRQMTGGDSSLAMDVLQIFRDKVAPMGRSLLEDEVGVDRKRVLHTLRGSASSIGANALADAGSAWEEIDSAGHRQRFEEILRATLADIDALLRKGL